MPRSDASRGKPGRAQRRRGYHHGDLRQALVRAARTLLADGGPAALTLRAAAREAGVSEAAPYRHFTSREDMLSAVAEDGFRRLHARMAEAAAPERGPRGLQQLAVEYARFALEQPAEYRIMFGREAAALERSSAGAALAEASGAVMDLLQGGIERLQQAGAVRPGDPETMALACWALMHGLVMLTLDGQGSRTRSRTVESLVEDVTSLLMTGMRR